ncbi:MAG: substrate-binding domain-containing protein, partial [Chloroflexi bacterium]|nr:substrate-binding domain-containing protein [Chloroflexota bacterium]
MPTVFRFAARAAPLTRRADAVTMPLAFRDGIRYIAWAPRMAERAFPSDVGGGNMVSDDAPQRPLSFAFVTPCVGEDFFRPVQRGMRDAARMLGVDCTFEGTADVDIPAQIELVRRAIARRMDGLALSIIHETAFNEVVGEAVRAGIPVVAFNV